MTVQVNTVIFLPLSKDGLVGIRRRGDEHGIHLILAVGTTLLLLALKSGKFSGNGSGLSHGSTGTLYSTVSKSPIMFISLLTQARSSFPRQVSVSVVSPGKQRQVCPETEISFSINQG